MSEPPDPDLALDVRFLEQEHRLLSILRNLLRQKDGERRAAASRSFRGWLLSAFLSGTVTAGFLGALLTFFTLTEMRKQTREMACQNGAVTLQNKYIADQIRIEGDQNYQTRKAQLLSITFDSERTWR